MHAWHGLMYNFRIVGVITVEIAVCPDPVHFASPADFPLADHRDVVFGLAGNGTDTASDTGIRSMVIPH